MNEHDMSPEDQEELRLADVVEKDLATRRQRIYQKYGMKASADVATKLKNEDEDATLFERLTPAERIQLRRENPDEWQRIVDAYGQHGMRRLLGDSL